MALVWLHRVEERRQREMTRLWELVHYGAESVWILTKQNTRPFLERICPRSESAEKCKPRVGKNEYWTGTNINFLMQFCKFVDSFVGSLHLFSFLNGVKFLKFLECKFMGSRMMFLYSRIIICAKQISQWACKLYEESIIHFRWMYLFLRLEVLGVAKIVIIWLWME